MGECLTLLDTFRYSHDALEVWLLDPQAVGNFSQKGELLMKRLFWLLFLVSCGSENGNKNQPPANPDKNPPPTNTDNPRLGDDQKSGWFGMVTKCLVDVTVKDKRLEQKIVCSETLQGDSDDDVSSKLESWRKANCPAVLDVRGNAADMGFLRFKAQGAPFVVSNSLPSVEKHRSEDGVCSNTHGRFNYGSPAR